ncbi:Emopamil binding protein-domain-containing protein [Tuber borchii]|uniref:Emopamil binding protein-domain-containing protein n=1 Tax=Tuber borchii TaxID=42251 RepID=A0A2T6ZHQ9_TUBBO|nr:Emopamil binding protein-domain-containing protein [Tuber borchii]
MHPYSPSHLLLPNYVRNNVSALGLCSVMGSLIITVVGSTWMFARTGLSTTDKAIVCWFLISGLLHLLFEGYFLVYHATLLSRIDLPAQLWKEYAISDSRYLSEDTFVLAIERITVFLWGPLCLLAAAATAKSSYNRHALQMLGSTAHIYGCLLYIVTSWEEGHRHSRPEPYYFWLYFVGFNAPWIVIPSILIYRSFAQIAGAMKSAQELEENKASALVIADISLVPECR